MAFPVWHGAFCVAAGEKAMGDSGGCIRRPTGRNYGEDRTWRKGRRSAEVSSG
ncbi:hypothetical protein IG631_06595 [Alternaria alternata]|nr:hypothetical protein IG631_06595 [Alternaria alternata]